MRSLQEKLEPVGKHIVRETWPPGGQSPQPSPRSVPLRIYLSLICNLRVPLPPILVFVNSQDAILTNQSSHVFFVTRTGDSTHRTPLVVMAQGSGFGRLLDVPSHKFEPLTDVFMQGENPEGQSALEDSRDATSSDDTVVVKCRRAVMVTAEAVSH